MMNSNDGQRRQLLRRIISSIFSFICIALLIIFLIWIILLPTEPRFILQDATVFAFNRSSNASATVNLTMQVTLTALNFNNRISIYYQNLRAYASYRGQQISLTTELAPVYQHERDVTFWSPHLNGTAVPLPPFLLHVLSHDLSSGTVPVNVMVNGTIKWYVGIRIPGKFRIHVNCPAYIKLAGDEYIGVAAAPAVKLQLLQSCNVAI